jgi:hypothetical protein
MHGAYTMSATHHHNVCGTCLWWDATRPRHSYATTSATTHRVCALLSPDALQQVTLGATTMPQPQVPAYTDGTELVTAYGFGCVCHTKR